MTMSKRLTVRGITSIKPDPRKRLEIPDGGTGLYLVVHSSGRKNFAVRYRNSAGRTRRMTLPLLWPADEHLRDGVLVAARERAAEVMMAVAAGRDPAAERQEERQKEPETVEAVFAEYLKRYLKRNQKRWQETERTFLRDVMPETKRRTAPTWHGRPIKSITKRDCIELLDSIVDRPAPILANRVHGHLRRFFGWCVERDILDHSPLTGVRPPAKETARDRFLSEDELLAFWRATRRMGSPFGAIFRLMLLTAARESEVAGMTWTEVDMQTATWILPAERSKNGEAHVIPLSAEAMQVLEAAWEKRRERAKPGPLVFPSRDSEERHASGFSRAKARLDRLMLRTLRAIARKRGDAPDEVGLPHWRLHDLRRSAASGMAGLGIPVHVVERLLNHTSGTFRGIVAVYQRHDFADEKRAAVDAWGRYLVSLNEPAAANVVQLREAQ